jgi:hypothetical protein
MDPLDDIVKMKSDMETILKSLFNDPGDDTSMDDRLKSV